MHHHFREIISAAPSSIIATLILAFSLAAHPSTQSEPQEVPPTLQPPVEEKLILKLHAKGDQIYTCKSENAQFTWTLKAPDAQLLRQGTTLWQALRRTHVAGQ